MNKIISTKERILMYLVGPSGSGKTVFINDMLQMKTLQPSFDRILYFYKHFQTIYDTMMQSIAGIEFIHDVDFELIENLPADGTKFLLIFDDSLETFSKSEKFNEIATADRHRNLNCVYIKHNLFHKNKTGRDAALQTTHIVLFKSPRDVQQIDILGRQLGLGRQLKQWYEDATQEPYGHLMIDLRPSTPDLLRYCSNVTSFPSEFFVPNSRARISDNNDKRTELLYSEALLESQQEISTNFPSTLS